MSDSAAEKAAEACMEQALRAERVALWQSRAGGWLERQHQGTLFTADDLVAAIGLPDTGVARNNAVGAWIGTQSRARRIEFTGEFRKSRRVEGHGNLQRLWSVNRDGDRVGGDAERLGPDGVSSSPDSPFPVSTPAAAVGERAESGSAPSSREPERAAADTASASAPPRWAA